MTDDNLASDFERETLGNKAKVEHPFDRSRWGLFPDTDIAKYHSGLIEEVTLSQSQMRRALDETMLDFAFHHPQLNPDATKIAASVAMHRGDVVHQLALGKGRGYAVADFNDWRTNDAKAFKASALAEGLTPIKRAEFEEAEVMAEVLREEIKRYLDGASYETEVAFLYQEMTEAGPIWVRGMLDVWCAERNMILDPKVTAQLYDRKVGRHVIDMGWDRQAALYPHAVGQIIGQEGRVKFRDLMVKPEAPFTSRVVALEKALEYSAIRQCKIAMERFGACLYAGRWPGFEETHYIPLPVWTARERGDDVIEA